MKVLVPVPKVELCIGARVCECEASCTQYVCILGVK